MLSLLWVQAHAHRTSHTLRTLCSTIHIYTLCRIIVSICNNIFHIMSCVCVLALVVVVGFFSFQFGFISMLTFCSYHFVSVFSIRLVSKLNAIQPLIQWLYVIIIMCWSCLNNSLIPHSSGWYGLAWHDMAWLSSSLSLCVWLNGWTDRWLTDWLTN